MAGHTARLSITSEQGGMYPIPSYVALWEYVLISWDGKEEGDWPLQCPCSQCPCVAPWVFWRLRELWGMASCARAHAQL